MAAIAIVVITVKLLADWWKKRNAKANSERSNDGIQPVTTEIKETDQPRFLMTSTSWEM